MPTQMTNSLEILCTEVAKVDVEPETATTEFIEGDIPVLQLAIRIGEQIEPCNVFLDREQCLRLRDVINKAFDDPQGWLYTPEDLQKAIRFKPPRLQPQG